MRVIYFSCFMAFFVLSSSCSYRQNHILFAKVDKPATAADSLYANQPLKMSGYRIQPGDVLRLRNLQNIKYIVDEVPAGPAGISGSGSASQGQTFEVEEDGTVALPALGHVAVAGLTRLEAAKRIEGLYRKDLLNNPIIELKIVNLKVTLFGEVGSQGNFPLLKENTTLVEIIGQAGGLTPNANEKNIKIIRGTGPGQTVTEIDLGDIKSIADPRAILQNGDIIYIAQNKRAVRTDKLQNLNTLVQPLTLLLSTVLIFFTLSRY